MNLKYRGANYEAHQSNIEITEEVIGRYRGAVVTRHKAKQSIAQAHPQGMKYRGAMVR